MAVTADVDIANLALQRLGQPVITALTDSGRDAEICNQLFAQNRNYCLMLADWQCVTDRKVLTRAGKKNVTGATQANPVVITTSETHTINANELITIEDVGGMTELNQNTFRAYSVTSVTITLYDTSGDSLDGTAYSAYSSTGTLYVAAGAHWARVYDEPSDCLRPLQVLDNEFGEIDDYLNTGSHRLDGRMWVRERGRIYTDFDDAGLKYLRLDTTASNYDELLVEVMASRLAWLIGMRIHADKQLRAEIRGEMNAAIARAKLLDASGRYAANPQEELWVNMG